MQHFFTQTIGRKISTLVGFSFVSLLLIIIISVNFFDKISEIGSLIEVGNSVGVAFYKSRADFEKFAATGSAEAFAQYEAANGYIQQKSGALEKLHRFIMNGSSVEEAVRKYGQTVQEYDHQAAYNAAHLIKTLMGTKVLADLQKTASNAYEYSVQEHELVGKFKATTDPGARTALIGELNQLSVQLEAHTAQILNDFKAVAAYLISYVRHLFYIAVLVILLPLGLLSFLITRSITTPLRQTVAFGEKMAQGDFTEKLSIRNRDELGLMATALNTMNQALSAMMRDIKQGIRTLGDSSKELFSISDQMSGMAGQTSDRSSLVTDSVEEMSAKLTSVAVAMAQSTDNLGVVATSSDEMTKTIDEIAQNAERARGVSDSAVRQAKSASTKMLELGDAAQRIGKVTETITEISEQTNLLALNATIEAARAGDSGKGFAVVANEIKELAKQTSNATQDIKQQISDIQNTTKTTITEIDQVSGIIDSINDIVATIATAVEEQSAVTREIASNIDQLSHGITEVSGNVTHSSETAVSITREIEDASQAATDMAQSSSQVKQSAEELSRLSDTLNKMVALFKVT